MFPAGRGPRKAHPAWCVQPAGSVHCFWRRHRPVYRPTAAIRLKGGEAVWLPRTEGECIGCTGPTRLASSLSRQNGTNQGGEASREGEVDGGLPPTALVPDRGVVACHCDIPAIDSTLSRPAPSHLPLFILLLYDCTSARSARRPRKLARRLLRTPIKPPKRPRRRPRRLPRREGRRDQVCP